MYWSFLLLVVPFQSSPAHVSQAHNSSQRTAHIATPRATAAQNRKPRWVGLRWRAHRKKRHVRTRVQAPLHSLSMRERVLRARALALKIRRYQRQLWKQDLYRMVFEKELKRLQQAPTQRVLRASTYTGPSRTQVQLQFQKHRKNEAITIRYVQYLQKKERAFGNARWNGQLYYHPQQGPVYQKIPGALALESFQDWKRFCQKMPKAHPAQIDLQIRPTRTLSWRGQTWQIQEVKGKSWNWGARLLPPENRYVHRHGDAMYMAGGCFPHELALWDTKAQRLAKLPAFPWHALFLQHPELNPWYQRLSNIFPMRLLSYDPQRKQAKVLFLRKLFRVDTARLMAFLLHWDLAQNKVTRVQRLPDDLCLIPPLVSYDTRQQTLHYLLMKGRYPNRCLNRISWTQRDSVSGGHQLIALHLPTGKRRIVLRLEHQQSVYRHIWSRNRQKLVIVEYETFNNINGKIPNRVFFLDLKRRTQRSHSIPPYPYGLAFSKDERYVFVYGSGKGTVTRFSFATGKPTHTRKLGGLGHAMGLSPNGRELYLVRHWGVIAFSPKNLKRRSTLPIERIIPDRNKDSIHVGGSAVAHGSLFIKDKQRLFILTPQK